LGHELGLPPVVIGPLYEGKTDQLYVPDDPICSDGLEFAVYTASAHEDSRLTRHRTSPQVTSSIAAKLS
jgi:hypothetical protein